MKATVELDNFTVSEADGLSTKLLVFLQTIRYITGEPIYITSGLRPGDPKAHGRGYAVDISDNQSGEPISSTWRMKVLGAALMVGLTRIGDYDRHIHIDVDPTLPQDVLWHGVSD